MTMSPFALSLLLAGFGTAVKSADLAVGKCTLAAKKDAAQARGYEGRREAVTTKLSRCGVAFDLIGDEQVTADLHEDLNTPIRPQRQLASAGRPLRLVARRNALALEVAGDEPR